MLHFEHTGTLHNPEAAFFIEQELQFDDVKQHIWLLHEQWRSERLDHRSYDLNQYTKLKESCSALSHATGTF